MSQSFFENNQLSVETLPRLHALVFQNLEKDYLRVSLIAASIFSSLFVIAAVIIVFFLSDELDSLKSMLILGAALIISSLIMWLTYKGFKFKKYALRQKDILFQSGYIFRSQTVVPFNRIQHCEINQGPIDRAFDLAALKIYTAGGSYSDLSIPGLHRQTAEDLKHFIIKKTAIGEEE